MMATMIMTSCCVFFGVLFNSLAAPLTLDIFDQTLQALHSASKLDVQILHIQIMVKEEDEPVTLTHRVSAIEIDVEDINKSLATVNNFSKRQKV